MKILITDCATLLSNNDLDLTIFDKFGTTVKYSNITRAELLKEAVDTDIILANKTVIDREVFEKAEKLKYVGVFATGYNTIDIKAAKERGIPVCNAGSYSTNAVAQQVIGYILMHYTKIHMYNDFVHNDGWINSVLFSPIVFRSDEVFGKTLGIIGFGNIGRAVKRAAEGLGMKVIVTTRNPKPDGDTVFVDFDTLLKSSDIVSLHCPLTEENADMMNAEAFAKMKDGAFFINTARGGLVDEKALFDALETGKLSAAAVDVIKKEPMPKDCILAKAKNLIITPHTAWAPLATRERLVEIVAGNLAAFLEGKTRNNVAV
ncbi:MAG: D-2-hydroxyacid dehydrogenase [Acutalibacteraceae bacterium]|jgi:glycerate dehydrogenase